MAEADRKTTSPTHVWIRYHDYLARKIKRGIAPYLAEQEIRHELDRAWLPFRYIGIDGCQYRELPPGYSWPDAEFGLDDSVVWPKEVDASESAADPFVKQFKQIELATARALGELPAPRKQLNIYQLELLAPVEAAAEPDPVAPAPADEPSVEFAELIDTPVTELHGKQTNTVGPIKPKTRHDRLVSLYKELKLPPDLKPAAVERKAAKKFHKRWPDEPELCLDNRRTTDRAYKKYLASLPPK